jgi:type IV pilus assembly protein PilA
LGRRRRGFTLVEVIVVLVILAILAAIAIPALTGYIDKARYAEIVQQARTQKVAFQAMIIDKLAEGGGLSSLYVDDSDTGDPTGASDPYFFDGGSDGSSGLYFLAGLTASGKAEYEKLTGDTKSFAIITGTNCSQPTMAIDASGAIKDYMYWEDMGATALVVFNIGDIDSISHEASYRLDDADFAKAKGLTSGVNVVLYTDIDDWEKVY